MGQELPTARIQLGPCTYVPLNLPPFELKWQASSDGKSVITPCLARKKTVALEPEEWVRHRLRRVVCAARGVRLMDETGRGWRGRTLTERGARA